MTVTLRSILRMILLLHLFAAPLLAAPVGSGCNDFLAVLHKKPNKLEFRDCKQQTDLQGQPWEASYRVVGNHAAEVESYLIKEFKVKRLHRTCCVWESVHNSYRDEQDRLYVISMSTDETTVDNRTQWARIPYFYIKVDLYPEAP